MNNSSIESAAINSTEQELQQDSPDTQWYNTAFGVLHYSQLGVACIGLLTNWLNFCVFWCEPVRRHYLSASLRLLSASDFFILLLYIVLTRTHLQNISEYACYATNYLFSLATFISPWILASITADRVAFIRHPAASVLAQARSRRRASVALFVVLFCGCAWSCQVKWSVGFGVNIGTVNRTYQCVASGPSALPLVDSTITSFAPWLLLLLMNVYILCKVRTLVESLQQQQWLQQQQQQEQQQQQHYSLLPLIGSSSRNGSSSSRSNSSPVAHQWGDKNNLAMTALQTANCYDMRHCRVSHQRQQHLVMLGQQQVMRWRGDIYRQQCQVTRMLLGFCVVYLLLNLPNHIILLLGSFLFRGVRFFSTQNSFMIYNMVRNCSQLLHLLHFSTNSLIYAYANRQYRVALCNFFTKCCPCREEMDYDH